MRKVNNPLYFDDALKGLKSQDLNRFKLTINALPALIRTHSDVLEFFAEEITNTLFRIQNKGVENFEELKNESLCLLLFTKPYIISSFV